MKSFCAILFALLLSSSVHGQQTITVLGTGYVGLVTGVCLAELNQKNQIKVICADIDEAKIKLLRNGAIPIYEPGLQELVASNSERNILHFSSNIPDAIQQADIIFIAVGTPTKQNGECDLTYFENALKTIAQSITTTPKTVVIKSTVPIGICRKATQVFDSYNIPKQLYSIIFNPEFLREGTAVHDFLNPDRIVMGTVSQSDAKILKKLYQPLLDKNIPCIVTDLETAETSKYASNNFLALKLSYINELSNLCEATGANIATVSRAIGLDHRIGPDFLKSGPGYGGSCLPKDTKALQTIAKNLGVSLHTVDATIKANKHQQALPFKKLKRAFYGDVTKKTVAVLGLAFKANTDDIRYSPAIPLIKKLLQHGAHIRAYDPVAMDNMRQKFPTITYCNSTHETIQGSDAVVIVTDWDEFKQLALPNKKGLFLEKIIIDPRNILNQEL